jgi:two-component system chemotaxis sensor kinase CheA
VHCWGIDIVDDGAGIDPEALKNKAVAKGLLTQEQAAQMSQRDAVPLIFHPGFSTAEQISDVSGRGVGMDVVRTNIERIGGTVDIQSEIGTGTTIQISLPLTLAIIPSMLIRTDGQRFAVPQMSIVELVRVRAQESTELIHFVKGAHVLKLRGSLLPLLPLDQVLRTKTKRGTEQLTSGARNIVVVESGHVRYGLIVDKIDDAEEIVVKPLGRHLKSCACLAGATILGDGHVAPILDIAGIAAECELQSAERADAGQEKESTCTVGQAERQSLLMFSNCPGEHFAVPMSLISRIERVHVSQIDSVGGQQLLQYRGTSLPLLATEDLISAQQREGLEHLHVVVFGIQGRETGLIAPRLDDISEIAAELDGVTFRQPGVAGSFVLDGHLVRLLDLYELMMTANPDWLKNRPVVGLNENNPCKILLAEDSNFFRKQVKDYLEGEGFDVVESEDGQAAWEELTAGQHEFDLVMTDIEMPRLNGFELTHRIKTDPTTQHLPVMALTSLASEADRERGRLVGVDEYQVKIDRDQVNAALERLLKPKKSSGKQLATNHAG